MITATLHDFYENHVAEIEVSEAQSSVRCQCGWTRHGSWCVYWVDLPTDEDRQKVAEEHFEAIVAGWAVHAAGGDDDAVRAARFAVNSIRHAQKLGSVFWLTWQYGRDHTKRGTAEWLANR